MQRNLAQRLYRFCLRIYPVTFRARYAGEMARVFDEGLRDARAKGLRQTVGYYCNTGADLLVSSTRERLSVLDRRSCFASFAAVGGGCSAAFVDFHATEVQATLLVILASSFAPGYMAPKRAWRWALLVAVWLPTIHVVAFAVKNAGSTQQHPYLSRVMMLLPALVVAFVGVYSGVVGRFICYSSGHFLRHRNDRCLPPSA